MNEEKLPVIIITFDENNDDCTLDISGIEIEVG
jgi:hypothetical protein